MDDIWIRVEKWLAANAQVVLESLQDGATEGEILELEQLVGARLPEDVRASLRRHNGQAAHADVGFVDAQEVLCIQRIRDEWTVWKDLLDSDTFADINSEPEDGVRNDWWNALWIPLTYDGSGNHYCVDLQPAAGGTSGQIITMWHDEPARTVLAPSFEKWLMAYALDLEQGRIVYSDEYAGLMNAEDP